MPYQPVNPRHTLTIDELIALLRFWRLRYGGKTPVAVAIPVDPDNPTVVRPQREVHYDDIGMGSLLANVANSDAGRTVIFDSTIHLLLLDVS